MDHVHVFLFNLSVPFPFSVFFWVSRILFMTLFSFLLISCISVILVVALGLSSIYCLQGVLYHFENRSWPLGPLSPKLCATVLILVLSPCVMPYTLTIFASKSQHRLLRRLKKTRESSFYMYIYIFTIFEVLCVHPDF